MIDVLQDPKHALPKASVEQQIFTCSRSTIETLEKGVRYVQI